MSVNSHGGKIVKPKKVEDMFMLFFFVLVRGKQIETKKRFEPPRNHIKAMFECGT